MQAQTHGMLTLIAQIDRKIKNAFVFVAAMSFTQGSHGFVNLPQAQSILSEPPVPIWVIDDDPAFAKGYAVWMQSRSSAEGRAFALSIVYQQLRLESLDSHADIPERDLESRYQSMWNMLTLEDRLLAFILQPETKELWRGSPSDGVSVEQFQRNREFVTATVLQLLTELDKQLALSEYLPTRLVDVAPSLPVYPGTHPEDINDPVVRAEYIEASREPVAQCSAAFTNRNGSSSRG